MSQKESILEFFRLNGDRLTLGQILKTHHAAEYRKWFSILRGEGYRIECKRNNKAPSENLYICIPPERSGQMRLV